MLKMMSMAYVPREKRHGVYYIGNDINRRRENICVRARQTITGAQRGNAKMIMMVMWQNQCRRGKYENGI